MWDLIVSVPDHCLSFYFHVTVAHLRNVMRKSVFGDVWPVKTQSKLLSYKS